MKPWDAFEAFQLALGPGTEPVILPFGDAPRMLYVRPPIICSRADFVALMQRIVSTPNLDPALPTLWDMRGHDYAECTAESCRSVAFALGEFTERRGVRRAFMVDSESGYGSARMFQQTASGYALEDHDNFLVSYDAEEIIGWLSHSA